MSEVTERLHGSCVPLVTPFADGAVDVAAFEASIERQIAAGSHGLVITGTTGEPTSLSADERALLYERAVDVAAGRLPVLAATGSPHQGETIELTARAAKAGVDGILVVTPAFVRPNQDGLRAHFTTVARSVELPVLIYNIPGRSGAGVTAETVVRVAEAAPNLVGIKHASSDLDLVTEVLLALGDEFRVFCGLESFSYPFLALGGAGLMNAVGNVLPERVAALCEAVEAGDHATALGIHRELFALNQAIFYDTNPGPLKIMLGALGAGSAEVRPPLAPVSDAVRERVLAAIAPLLDGAVATEAG